MTRIKAGIFRLTPTGWPGYAIPLALSVMLHVSLLVLAPGLNSPARRSSPQPPDMFIQISLKSPETPQREEATQAGEVVLARPGAAQGSVQAETEEHEVQILGPLLSASSTEEESTQILASTEFPRRVWQRTIPPVAGLKKRVFPPSSVSPPRFAGVSTQPLVTEANFSVASLAGTSGKASNGEEKVIVGSENVEEFMTRLSLTASGTKNGGCSLVPVGAADDKGESRPAARSASGADQSLMIPPKPSPRNPFPPYPVEARRKGLEGRLLLEIKVSATGSVARVRVCETSLQLELDRSAMKTVQEWVFEPAYRNGEPVDAVVLLPVIFKLR